MRPIALIPYGLIGARRSNCRDSQQQNRRRRDPYRVLHHHFPSCHQPHRLHEPPSTDLPQERGRTVEGRAKRENTQGTHCLLLHNSSQRKADRHSKIDSGLGHAGWERRQRLSAHNHRHHLVVEIGVA